MYDNGGGLNGSTQHLLEAHAQGFQQLRIVRQRDSGTPSWLGVIDYSRTFRFSTGKRCPINSLNGVASTG
jgi:hypothetical protein